MKESVKLERALKAMPWEIIVQYSSQTDSVKILFENATNEAKEDGITVLEVFKRYAEEVIETYESELLGHINYEMQFEDKKLWREELTEAKDYLKKLNKYIGK